MQPLDGHFAFSTTLKETFITANGGGGRITDVIHTDTTYPRSWELFRLWTEEGSEFYALQTIDGHFVTAVDAGGRTTDTIHTDATSVAGWELFKLAKIFGTDADPGFSGFALETSKDFFLTAVGGGGHNNGDTIHTDATAANPHVNQSWELLVPWRVSEFGTGSTYGINIWGGNHSEDADLRGFMVAHDGGGDPGQYALWLSEGEYPVEISWTLLRQPDGTYALQTYNGTVLSAVGGGAPGVGGFRSDTPVDSIGDAEKFTLEDQGDFTVCIKTIHGTYISLGEGVVAGQSWINRALKFRLQLFDLAPGPTG